MDQYIAVRSGQSSARPYGQKSTLRAGSGLLRLVRSVGVGAAAMLALQTPALADTMYITDILRLGLHRASDTGDKPFETLVSGAALEILERTTYYARVRTVDGQEGWVKASYLVDEKPSQARLADLSRERDTLASELGTLRSQLSTQAEELKTLRTARQTLEQDATTATSELAELRTENASLSTKVAQYRFSVPIHWLLLAAGATLVAGLIGGWRWCDLKQRQRHGGFRL